MEKRGINHIEIVLSFIIFVGAIGFALFFFNPSNTNRLVETNMEYTFNEIIENTTSKLTTYFIAVNNTNGQINGNDAVKVHLPDVCLENGAHNPDINPHVVNTSGAVIPSKIGTGNSGCVTEKEYVFIDKISENWPLKEFIYLRISDAFGRHEAWNQISQPNQDNEEFYEIASTAVESLISENKTLVLNDTYYTNYFALKDYFNLPGRVNFGFSLIFEDGEITAEREIPKGLEVFVDSRRMEVLRVDGSREFADLLISIW